MRRGPTGQARSWPPASPRVQWGAATQRSPRPADAPRAVAGPRAPPRSRLRLSEPSLERQYWAEQTGGAADAAGAFISAGIAVRPCRGFVGGRVGGAIAAKGLRMPKPGQTPGPFSYIAACASAAQQPPRAPLAGRRRRLPARAPGRSHPLAPPPRAPAPPGPQVSYLRAIWQEAGIRAAHPTGYFAAVHCGLLLTALTHLGLIYLAPCLYRRRRAAVQIAMRLVRLAMHVDLSLVSRAGRIWWSARLLLPASEPARALNTALAGAAVTAFVVTMLNPCPFALHAKVWALPHLLTWTHGWLENSRGLWEHPKLAAASGAACEWLQLMAAAANNASVDVFG
jgi:hypothetical protein